MLHNKLSRKCAFYNTYTDSDNHFCDLYSNQVSGYDNEAKTRLQWIDTQTDRETDGQRNKQTLQCTTSIDDNHISFKSEYWLWR